MEASWAVVRRALDEEIEKLGSWWPTENCWVAVRGELMKTGEPIDEIDPVFQAVAVRTGVALTALTERYRPGMLLLGKCEYLTSSRAHRERRLADDTLRRVEPSEGRGDFELYCPVADDA